MDNNWLPWLKMAEQATLELKKFKEMLKSEEPVDAFDFLVTLGKARATLGTIETLVTWDIEKSNVK